YVDQIPGPPRARARLEIAAKQLFGIIDPLLLLVGRPCESNRPPTQHGASADLVHFFQNDNLPARLGDLDSGAMSWQAAAQDDNIGVGLSLNVHPLSP